MRSLKLYLGLALVGCGGPEATPLPSSGAPPPPPFELPTAPAPLTFSTLLVDAAGIEVAARLVVPSADPPPLAIVVPGLGPSTAVPARDFQPGQVGLLTLGKPGCGGSDPITCDPEVYRSATRPAIQQHVRLAYEWARSLGLATPTGHVLFAQATAAPDALALAPIVGAELVVWSYPVLQGMRDYLEDELLRRSFWTHTELADADCDGGIDPEEWGFYRGAHAPDAPAFATLDEDGDGLYTAEDAELAGAADWAELQAIVDADDEAAWTAFWGNDQRFPSVAWARATWEPPPVEDWLLATDARVEVLHHGHVAAPPEPVLALVEAHPQRFTLPLTAPYAACRLSIAELGQEP